MNEPEDSTSASAGERNQPSLTEWSIASRIAFRFVFCYALLLLGSYAAFFGPLTFPIALVSEFVWTTLVDLVARHLLFVPTPPLASDGDGLGHWIQLGCLLVFAVAATVVWSTVDRQRKNYVSLHKWLRVILRYALGIAMVTYGLAKVFHLQMLPPHLAKLVQPYGESSPTSLLWILMGSSAAYSAFTGAVETLGGVLLFNRHTTTLGALITLGAMAHVVALNLSYDVSVKIWSLNLLALTIVLLAPDLPRLTNIFVLNRQSAPVAFSPLFRRQKTDRICFTIGMICLAITVGFRTIGLLNGRGQAHNRTPVALYGIYDVESFLSNGELLPPLLTDTVRWRTVIIERSGLASIRLMNDEVVDYLTSVNTVEGTVTFIANPDDTVTTAGATRLAYNPRLIEERFARAFEASPTAAWRLDFSRSEEDTLTFSGRWEDDSVRVQLGRRDETQFLLLNRGFHWVQPYPFFR